MYTTKMKITYYAPDDTMGDCLPDACEKFRNWAEAELKNNFPDHEISVSDQECFDQVYTDDEERREEIQEFCARLWESCPWDWE